MKNILQENNILKPPKTGDIIEGVLINKEKASVFFDLGPSGTGIIYGKEFYEAKDELKEMKVGDKVFAKIVDLENEEGYIELSLRKAGKEIAWDQLKQQKEDDEIISVKITGANKGGLLAYVSGIPAFLPASQLSYDNYPKVEGGDNQKILQQLQGLVGREMQVKIFDLSQKENKLILSEKAKESGRIKEILKNFNIGDVVEGEITGIVDFGAFVKFPALISPKPEGTEGDAAGVAQDGKNIINLEGLIHISELDWQLIENPMEIVKTGEKVKAKIIEISNDKVFLSLKALKKDPWENIAQDFKAGDITGGKVTKINPFGAFVQISPKIQGLCHISEFASKEKMEENLVVGEKYNFKILSLEPKEHRMTLKLDK